MNQPKSAERPRSLKLTDSFSHQLSVTARRVAQQFAAQYASKCDINTIEWRTLAVIADQGAPTPSAISAASGMDKVIVSRATASLLNRGLLKRVTDRNDGRVCHLSLTRRGIVAQATAAQVTRELEATLAAGMSNSDLSALWKGLKLLDEMAGKLAAEAGDKGAEMRTKH